MRRISHVSASHFLSVEIGIDPQSEIIHTTTTSLPPSSPRTFSYGCIADNGLSLILTT